MNERLALSSEEINEKKQYSLNIFNKWLNDQIDEDNLTSDKIMIIENYQILLDSIVPEKIITKYLNLFHLENINELINNKACLGVIYHSTGINKDLIIAKAICMKKNQEKENQEKKVKFII